MTKEYCKFINKEDIKKYFDGNKIQCLICGKMFKALGTHLWRTHGIFPDQYKAQFGLPWSSGLCGRITRKKFKRNADKLRKEGKILTGVTSAEHYKNLHKQGPRRITPAHSLDRRIFYTNLGKRNKYSALNFEECWRLFKGGLTQKEIGKKFNVSQMTISRFMRKANKYQEDTKWPEKERK